MQANVWWLWPVSKYAPLGDFLRKQRRDVVPMSFSEIERVVGSKLPKSQRYPAWWSNNPWNNVMTQVWLDAGFQTEQVIAATTREQGCAIVTRGRELLEHAGQGHGRSLAC